MLDDPLAARNALAASCSGSRRRWAIGTTLPRFRDRSELSMWPTGLMPPIAPSVAVGGISEVFGNYGNRFYAAVLSPGPRAVVARARYLVMLVAIDQMTSARMPGR